MAATIVIIIINVSKVALFLNDDILLDVVVISQKFTIFSVLGPISGRSVLISDFAARKVLVFNDLFAIFIPKRNTFGIIMLMRQI